jgi:hypothetical protein
LRILPSNLSPEAAEKSYRARLELYRLYEAAPDKDAFVKSLVAQVPSGYRRAAVESYFLQLRPIELVRGMSHEELDVIAATGVVANQVGYGTFATAQDTAAYTNVKVSNVRLPGLGEPSETTKPGPELGPFFREGEFLKFRGLMSEGERDAIMAYMKKTYPAADPAQIEKKVTALYNQTQSLKTREVLIFFKAPRAFFESAGYDFSIANQGARMPSYEFLAKMQDTLGGKALTRDEYEHFVTLSQRLGRDVSIDSFFKVTGPHIHERVAVLMKVAHDQRFGAVPADFIDVEKTLEANRDRLRPESYEKLKAGLKKLKPN